MLIHGSTKYYVTSLLELRLWRMPSMYRLVRTQSMTPVTLDYCRPCGSKSPSIVDGKPLL